MRSHPEWFSPFDDTKIGLIWYYVTHNTIYFKVVGGVFGVFFRETLNCIESHRYIARQQKLVYWDKW